MAETEQGIFTGQMTAPFTAADSHQLHPKSITHCSTYTAFNELCRDGLQLDTPLTAFEKTCYFLLGVRDEELSQPYEVVLAASTSNLAQPLSLSSMQNTPEHTKFPENDPCNAWVIESPRLLIRLVPPPARYAIGSGKGYTFPLSLAYVFD